jgi:putative ABC transport system ATP-binding protein
MIEANGVTRTYVSGGRPLTVLEDITLTIRPGEFAAIVGASGSGKTTLLGLLAGLDLPSRGIVRVDGNDLGALDEDGRARIRRERIGFVFQSFQLIPTLTALENVEVPLELRGESAGDRARDLLTRVGLGDRIQHYPAQLSGGEQQRVALARAFSTRPRYLFADEPTGSLDTATGREVERLLEELNAEAGTTLVLVTHEAELAARATRTIRLSGGRLVEDTGA